MSVSSPELRGRRPTIAFPSANTTIRRTSVSVASWSTTTIWSAPARTLLEAHGTELRDRPAWLFSSGPTGDPPLPEEAEPVGIAEALEATGARSHQVFAGRIELERLKRRERLLVSAMRAPVGDYRDWEAIRSWARTVGRELDGTAAS